MLARIGLRSLITLVIYLRGKSILVLLFCFVFVFSDKSLKVKEKKQEPFLLVR